MSVKGWEVVFKGERLQADLVAAVLEARGINVEVLWDTAGYGAAMNLTEARVFVPEESAAEAREVLTQAEA